MDREIAQYEPGIERVRFEMLAVCSDSRTIRKDFNYARDEIVAEEARDGTLVIPLRETVAGVHMTDDAIASIKTGIERNLKKYRKYHFNGVPIEIVVNVFSHGNVELREGETGHKHSVHEIKLADPHCSTNCGMMHAQEVAADLEKELLDGQVTITYSAIGGRKKEWKIIHGDDIRAMMTEVYGYTGLISAGWVHSIVDLGQHAAEQKTILRKAFNDDPVFRNMGIHINAAVQNFVTNTLYRVDENPGTSFLERVYARMRENIAKHGDMEEGATAKQNPHLGLIHVSDVHNARQWAVETHLGEGYEAGLAFAISGELLEDFYRPVGRYKILSVYYGAKNLGLKEWVVVGRSKDETDMIISRFSSDPLLAFVKRHYGIKYIPMVAPAEAIENHVNPVMKKLEPFSAAKDIRDAFPGQKAVVKPVDKKEQTQNNTAVKKK
ncbi:Uncharacterised protein [uncultured archaeon]|nr:Uncharacterised protein [uncultured archaeon]